MLSLSILRTFVAVVDEASVVGASRLCGYSPAGVSRQMTHLQGRVGMRLFEPDGRGIRPTALGERLADAARGLLSESARFDAYVRELSRGQDEWAISSSPERTATA